MRVITTGATVAALLGAVSNVRLNAHRKFSTTLQIAYAAYDLTWPATYTIGTARLLREDCGICQKHHRIVCCQIPYRASQAVQQS